MVKGIVCMSFLVSMLLSSGCASSPVFKPEFMGADQRPNLDRIRQTANTSSDIISFASKIYDEIIEEDEHSMEVDRVNSGSSEPHYDEFVQFMGIKRVSLPLRFHLNVFKEYCGSKNGTAYRWLVKTTGFEYSNMYGNSQELITCEVKKEVVAGLFFVVSRGRKNPSLPYVTETTFVDAARFADYMKRNRLFGYRSSNGIFMIPGNVVLTEPNSKDQVRLANYAFLNTNYAFLIDYKNSGGTPREINYLNSSVQLNGKEYSVVYRNHGMFVDVEGGKETIRRLNPGQQLKSSVLFSIPGVDVITENDLSSFVFNLDGLKAQDFKRFEYYDQFKAPLKD